MKTTILYFSRTGETKNLAQTLAKSIGADTYELKDNESWVGPLGLLKGIYLSAINKKMDIRFDEAALDSRHLILMSPMWLKGPAPAVKTFLSEKEHANISLVMIDRASPMHSILNKYLNKYASIKKTYGITHKKNNADDILSKIIANEK